METTSNTKLHGVFSADKITKYWKNQTPHQGDGHFVDPVFPPNQNSLMATDLNGNFLDQVDGPKKAEDVNSGEIEWKRAEEIFSKFLLFDEKIECSDIKQGNLGNCYFLSALAALTEFPQLIYQIFRTKEANPQGYYEVVLFVDGEWVVVPVDDYFPVKQGSKNLSFARPNGNELWVILLEKAWAKVNGGYVNIISGWPSDALAALTGFSNQKLTMKDFNLDDLWEILQTSDKSDNIMCTSTKSDKSIEELGLVVNHAYTLVGAKEIQHNGELLRLVRIRNPWGHKEWLGAWSDNDSRWTPELDTYFEHTIEDDGTFFMALNEFTQLFDSTHICHVMYDSNIKSFRVPQHNLNKPHIFNLYLQEETKVSISVCTKHWRYNRELKNVTHPISLVIAKYDVNTKTLSKVDGDYSAYENLEFAKVLQPGLYAVWVYCSLNSSKSPKPESYSVIFASSTKYRVKLESFDSSFEFIKELIIAGVRENNAQKIQESEQFYSIENQFKRTGLGYRLTINRSATVHQKWVNDASGLQNMTMLPPHEGKSNVEFLVPPNGTGICIGMKNEQYGSYWFNLSSEYFTTKCNAGQDPTNSKKVNHEVYINNEVQFDEVDEDYYDYISSSLQNAKKNLEFQHVDTKSVLLDELNTTHPEFMQILLDLPNHDDENLLTWGKLIYENGFYVGQYQTENQKRHGRGAYHFSDDGITYAGYWNNNRRDRFGKLLDKNNKVSFEGGYQNNMKNGKGKYIWSNGDYYEGNFEDDKRNGKGIYVWIDGSSWEGNFENNQMHGAGKYDPNDGSEAWEVEYNHGQAI